MTKEHELGELRELLDGVPGLHVVTDADGVVQAAYGAIGPELEAEAGRFAAVGSMRPLADGTLRCWTFVVTDISERERAERVERDFVANASHELRTPIATISGAIEILQAGAKDVPEARERFLRHIDREVSRLGRLVGALLTLARAQAGHELPDLAPVVLRPVLEDAAERLDTQPDVEVVVACPDGLSVIAHPDLLMEVVQNLASNAAKYTREGRIVLRGVPVGDAVTVEVRDTGPGIPADVQESVFGRFYRGGDRRGDGFGLGLAIVREAVNALGGGIEIDSAPEAGTTVRVTLPQAKHEVAA